MSGREAKSCPYEQKRDLSRYGGDLAAVKNELDMILRKDRSQCAGSSGPQWRGFLAFLIFRLNGELKAEGVED